MDKIQRGMNADALLENEMLKESMAALGNYYTQAWHDADKIEAREDCHRYMKLIERFWTDLRSVSNTGKLEQARILELERGRKGFTWPKVV